MDTNKEITWMDLLQTSDNPARSEDEKIDRMKEYDKHVIWWDCAEE